MPEGPEVECTKQSLSPLIGKKVREVKLTTLSQKYPKYKNEQINFDEFTGQKLVDIVRKGKFLIFRFSKKKVILNHLGMSGKWVLVKDENQQAPKHQKAVLYMESLPHAIFDDARNFGQFRVYESYEAVLKYDPIRKLGVDGLKKPFPIEEFLQKLSKKNYMEREIGAILLDQKLVAGVGNIYKSESLFLAKINPLRRVKDLKTKEREALGNAIPEILHKAVKYMGSTFQSYKNPEGEEGSAQKWHKVYAKEGKKCQECNFKIQKVVQNKRSTYYCPKCQM